MGVEAKAWATEEDRVNTTTCMPGTSDKKIFIDDEKAMFIPTQISRDIRCTMVDNNNQASIRSKLDDVGVQRTACWRVYMRKYYVVGNFLFSEKASLSKLSETGFAD